MTDDLSKLLIKEINIIDEANKKLLNIKTKDTSVILKTMQIRENIAILRTMISVTDAILNTETKNEDVHLFKEALLLNIVKNGEDFANEIDSLINSL